jgi:hypothetical protein
MDYDHLEDTVNAMLERPLPRRAGVIVAADGMVSWDHGEEWLADRPPRWGDNTTDPILVDRTSSGLTGLMAVSNCEHANALYRGGLAAVMQAVAQQPFPLGRGREVYLACLAAVEAAYIDLAGHQLMGVHSCLTSMQHWLLQLEDGFPNLGALRKALVIRAGSGCNAPVDSYLRIAYHVTYHVTTETDPEGWTY